MGSKCENGIVNKILYCLTILKVEKIQCDRSAAKINSL